MTEPSVPPSPLPSDSAAQPEKKNYTGCIIGGCAAAVILALIGIAVAFFFIFRSGDFGSKGAFTFSFDPIEKSPLAVGSDGKVGDDEWPATIAEFQYDGPAFTEGKEFDDKEIGGAVYIDSADDVEIYVSIVPYETIEQYQRIVNNTVKETLGDGDSELSVTQNCVIFSTPNDPALKFAFRPFKEHASYFTFDFKEGEAWDNDRIDKAITEFFIALGGAIPSKIGFSSSATLEKGDLGYPTGPSLENGVSWVQPDPQQDKFALSRSGIRLPDKLSSLEGQGAAYSALNFEADVSVPVETFFIPKKEDEDQEQEFQRVLKAISEDGETIPHVSFESFTISEENAAVTLVVTHRIEKEGGEFIVTVYDNGVLVSSIDTLDEKATEAFGGIREISLAFAKVMSLGWHNAEP